MAGFDLLERCADCEHTYIAHHKGARCLRNGCRCRIHMSLRWRSLVRDAVATA